MQRLIGVLLQLYNFTKQLNGLFTAERVSDRLCDQLTKKGEPRHLRAILPSLIRPLQRERLTKLRIVAACQPANRPQRLYLNAAVIVQLLVNVEVNDPAD